MRTNANSSCVHAAESSPYIVRNAEILQCQGRGAVMASSSFGRGKAARPSQPGGPSSDALTRVLNWTLSRLIPVHNIDINEQRFFLYASLSEIRLVIAVAVGKLG